MIIILCVCCRADGAGKLYTADPTLQARRAVSETFRNGLPETIKIL